MTADEFVDKVASENPIVAFDSHNECKFCQTSWAEDNYQEYLKNKELIIQNPEAGFPNRSWALIKWEHHDSDCVWVLANEIHLTTGSK